MERDLIRKYFLEANPREDRQDCPDEATLQAIAENRFPLNHPARLHLPSCSPCFAELNGDTLSKDHPFSEIVKGHALHDSGQRFKVLSLFQLHAAIDGLLARGLSCTRAADDLRRSTLARLPDRSGQRTPRIRRGWKLAACAPAEKVGMKEPISGALSIGTSRLSE